MWIPVKELLPGNFVRSDVSVWLRQRRQVARIDTLRRSVDWRGGVRRVSHGHLPVVSKVGVRGFACWLE
jgi:hypothetical protein